MNLVDVSVIASARGITDRGVRKRAQRENWVYSERSGRGGRVLYNLADLPADIQAAVVLHLHKTGQIETPAPAPTPQPEAPPSASREWTQADSDALWQWASTRSQALRDKGMHRAQLMMEVEALLIHSNYELTATKALQTVAQQAATSWKTMWKWWAKGANGEPLQNYPRSDWAALLIPGYVGCTVRKEIPVEAWDFFISLYLKRSKPTVSDTYRRTEEAAQAQGWGVLPSEDTFRKRLGQIPRAQIVFMREGPEALGQIFPPQRRDRSMLKAGEMVNGDGLKFDRLWVRFEDGEIINTATGWFWQDEYSGKVLAYRLGKTENTDLFRLATYDLTAICKPHTVMLDNTPAAANKAMTGQTPGRNRFTNRPDDPIGLLNMLDIRPQFTKADKVMSQPGVKRVERVFGKGGLHEMVATSPRLKDQGYSKKTAIDFDLLQQIVAEEVARFNARPNRQTGVCRGVLSFDQAFEESFSKSEVNRLSESQRALLLLMPEVVTCNKRSGEIKLKAGSGPWGAHRYWDESLSAFAGKKVTVYYDPENLLNDVSVYRLDGQFITTAAHIADVPVITDTSTSREWMKNKSRFVKANKTAAKAQRRMDDLTAASYYPALDDAPIPEPGIVRPNFGMQHSAADGIVTQRKVANGGWALDDEQDRPDERHMLDWLEYQSRRKEEDF